MMRSDLWHEAQTRRANRRRKLPPCADRSRELLAGEVARLGLDTRNRWHPCTTGAHPAHCRCERTHPRS